MRRIVVGVDDSPGAELALRWALDEAHLRQAELEVVHAWLFPAVGDVAGAAVDTIFDDLERGAGQLLDRVIGRVVGANPGVKVEWRTVEGPPGRILVDAAADADLLVVGSRGRGGFAGLLLGSVAQQCMHHAPCPVVVVRGT